MTNMGFLGAADFKLDGEDVILDMTLDDKTPLYC
jgi:hypothetical protein